MAFPSSPSSYSSSTMSPSIPLLLQPQTFHFCSRMAMGRSSSSSSRRRRTTTTTSLVYSRPLRSASTRASAAAFEPEPSSSPLVDEVVGVETLRRFVHLNSGNWNGSFYFVCLLQQYDPAGNVLNVVSTRLAASSYGEDELMSLIQTLYIKEATSGTSISGSDDKPDWVEYKIKETNMFTVDKYQQFADWFLPQ